MGGGCRLSRDLEDMFNPVPQIVLLALRARGESWWVRGRDPVPSRVVVTATSGQSPQGQSVKVSINSMSLRSLLMGRRGS